jgi:hypothetical protein
MAKKMFSDSETRQAVRSGGDGADAILNAGKEVAAALHPYEIVDWKLKRWRRESRLDPGCSPSFGSDH